MDPFFSLLCVLLSLHCQQTMEWWTTNLQLLRPDNPNKLACNHHYQPKREGGGESWQEPGLPPPPPVHQFPHHPPRPKENLQNVLCIITHGRSFRSFRSLRGFPLFSIVSSYVRSSRKFCRWLLWQQDRYALKPPVILSPDLTFSPEVTSTIPHQNHD